MRNKPPPVATRVSAWIGKRVRLLCDVNTGQAIYPAGALAVVKDLCRGLTLVGDACSCCKVRIRMTRVPASYVELADQPPEPTQTSLV